MEATFRPPVVPEVTLTMTQHEATMLEAVLKLAHETLVQSPRPVNAGQVYFLAELRQELDRLHLGARCHVVVGWK